MLSAVVTAKAQENCGFPGVAPDCVCPVTANPGQGKTHEGPPLRFPYQLAVSAVQTEYRPVPGLERPSLTRTGTLHSCIAEPVLTWTLAVSGVAR